MRRLKRFISSFLIAGLLLVPISAGTAAAWDPFGSACTQNKGKQSAVCKDSQGTGDLNQNPMIDLIANITQIAIIVAGAAVVIMLILSGFRLITSGGDPQKAAQARKALIGSIVGLIVVVLAQAIVSLVIGQL